MERQQADAEVSEADGADQVVRLVEGLFDCVVVIVLVPSAHPKVWTTNLALLWYV